jgi:uncharacterized protein (TIGR02145 family)
MTSIFNRQIAVVTTILIMTMLNGCKKEIVPVVETVSVREITGSSAVVGGIITEPGSSIILERGVCWSTNPLPTISDHKTTDGPGAGSFISNLADLTSEVLYYVRAYATSSAGTGYGIAISFVSSALPPLASPAATTNINSTSASFYAKINANNLSTEVSFEFGTTTNYGNTKAAIQSPVTGGIETTVSADIEGLNPATYYHYRLKATNLAGTTYGKDMIFATIFTDVEGNKYNIKIIGSQIWMQENLKTTRYNNGDLIGTTPFESDDMTGAISPKYQWQSSIVGYGRLYTYYAITDSRKVCPAGWHVPSDGEWLTLTDYLTKNNYGYGGDGKNIAKSLAATSGWFADPTKGNVGNDQVSNNKSGFTGLPGGGRYSNGVVKFVGYHGIWWSSSESSGNFAYFRCIGYVPAQVFRGQFDKSYGLTVRCLKDS